MRRLLALSLVLVAAVGCSKSSKSSSPTETTPGTLPTTSAPGATTAPTTSTVAETTLLRVYFLTHGRIGPVARAVPATQAVATAALAALSDGPTADDRAEGFTTALPAGAAVSGLRIANGVATIDLPQNVSHEALAQVVYTLTQFPTVKSVRPSRSLGGSTSLTRADFEDVTPAILVESPLPGQAVTSPLEVRGAANTFEATFDLEVRNSSGVRIAWRFVTATSGSGQRGTFDTTISFARTGGPLTLVAYEPSAESGKPIHVVRIPLREG
jgi:germination protein M